MNSSRSRFFTLLCVFAMVAGLAAAAWARTSLGRHDGNSPAARSTSESAFFGGASI